MSSKYQYTKKTIEKRKEMVTNLKSNPCKRCNVIYHHSAMQFHHIDPKTKKFAIGRGLYRNSIEKILEEANKCILLCSNCHAITHFEEKQNRIIKC